MDFERFTRSILLAQGGFDTFLKADTEQKSRILEQITGTEIYTTISQCVHERQREEKDKLQRLQDQISGINILDDAQAKKLTSDLEIAQKQEAEMTQSVNQTKEAIIWLKSIESLQNEIGVLIKDKSVLNEELIEFEPRRLQLAQAIKAATLDGIYATLINTRNQKIADETFLSTKSKEHARLESSLKNKAEILKNLEAKTKEAKEKLKQEVPIIHKVKLIDQRLVDLQKNLEQEEKALQDAQNTITSKKQAKEKAQINLAAIKNDLQTIETYIQQHAQDQWLISGLAGVEEQLNNLANKQQEITKAESARNEFEKNLIKANEALEKQITQTSTKKQTLKTAEQAHQQANDKLKTLFNGRLLREYRSEKEGLQREKFLLDKIVSLEAHRAQLKDNQPCPLCGAKEHPYAKGNVPVSDEIDKKIETLITLINAIEEQEAEIKKLAGAEITARNDLVDSEKLEMTAKSHFDYTEKSYAELKTHLAKANNEFATLEQNIVVKLKPLGIKSISNISVSSLLASLKNRLIDWQNHGDKKAKAQQNIDEIDGEMKTLEAVMDALHATLTDKQTNLEKLNQEYQSKNNDRKILYADKDPEAEEKLLTQLIEKEEQCEKQERDIYNEQQRTLTVVKADIDSTKKRIEKTANTLSELEADFLKSLKAINFSDETQFLKAILPNENRLVLANKEKQLNYKQSELTTKLQDRESSLTRALSEKLTDKTIIELEPHYKECEEKLKQLQRTIANINVKLEENTINKNKVNEVQQQIELQKIECKRWDKLHTLIGSADGKKYRNFAQGLTFELMVSHANQQLKKMTERYLLIRDEEQPLALNVVDNYQAGEIRSVKNLSGGESFIVSLTLALGLSKMASRKVRVDSLFLDEGFGTLDEDALETALDTLSELQQDNKLIGIISHVPALKERISTQITVTPISSGRSMLAGIGCDQVRSH